MLLGKVDHASHAAAIARASKIGDRAPLLRAHLIQILESREFKGSRRSQDFLRYAVENALDGTFDRLKERTIGVELFSRRADYNTGEDSIVRVSASDVRRRLHQYYLGADIDSEVQIDLPAGSYIPEFRHIPRGEPLPPSAPESARVTAQDAVVVPPAPSVSQETPPREPVREVSRGMGAWWKYIPFLVAILSIALAAFFWNQSRLLRAGAAETPVHRSMPWSTLFEKGHRLQIVVSDTGFSAIQDLLGVTIPLSDYVGFRYPQNNLSPETARLARFISQRQFTAVLDVGLVTRISELASTYGTRIEVRSARGLHVEDFKNDDNFILLGSARANPWAMLYDQQLDFSVEYVPEMGKLIFHNKHPKPGEAAVYIPTATFGQTGDSYAMLAFVGNPNQRGSVLLIAGTSAEGTEMAGKLVTNVDTLATTLRKSGVDPAGAPRKFQLLLRLSTMAGSAGGFDVVAFHSADPSVH